MSALKNSTTIPKDVSTGDDLDFEYLRRIGIQHIAALGGGLWTDYNEHDPGITILEMLSYAITDLGNRINLPMPDLLTDAYGTPISTQFYTAEQILPGRAVTSLDYRKLFIDMEGVRNCWILPFKRQVFADCRNERLSYDREIWTNVLPQYRSEFPLKGLNRIIVDFDVDETDPVQRAVAIEAIKEQMRVRYHANRNLCEDLVEITEVEEHPISVCTTIEVENEADEDAVNARVLFEIEAYFSPFVHFYSLKQMLDKGYRMDEIFEGPLLESGFIDTEELRQANLRSEVRLSDLIRLIMAVPGVKQIVDISIGNCNDNNNPNDWLICIEPYKRPALCDKSFFSYRKEKIPVRVNKQRSEEILNELKAAAEAYNDAAAIDRFPKLPEGEYLDAGWYTTIQNDFPETYGISPEGLMPTASTVRKSQSKQLKAYLLFFDQVLASYFAHLANARDLFTVNPAVTNTYFTQAVKDISGFSELVENYDKNDDAKLSKYLFDGLADDIQRRNELIDHLMARFAESFTTYAFLMKELYGSFADEMVLRSKEAFLHEYVALSSERGLGFNYYRQLPADLWNTGNVAGVKKRVARLSGIKNYFRRNLSDSFIEIYESAPGVFRWKIRNAAIVIILSSVKDYPSFSAASNDMYFAVLQLIETVDKDIEAAYDAGLSDNQVIGNIRVKISGQLNYYFQVVNPALPEADPNFIIAKQPLYFPVAADMVQSLLDTIAFMRYDFTEEGMFIVEHILLRPDVTVMPPDPEAPYAFMPFCADDCSTSCCGIDPYSFRVSIVLPGYTQRFSNIDFRKFMEELIREELPAHVLAKICWVGSRKGEVPNQDNQLMQFEGSYKNYLVAKTTTGQAQPPELIPLIDNLTHLHTIFPTGKLHNCEEDDHEGDIILGRTKLGTL